MCLDPYLTDLGSHAALNEKTNIYMYDSTVEQLFGVQIICIRCTLFELCVREKKITKSKLSHSIFFSTVRRIKETLEAYFTLEYLRVWCT